MRRLLLLVFLLLPVSAFADPAVLTWPVQVGDASITGFKVYQGTASGVYGPGLDVGKVQTFTATCPPQTVTYSCFFAISAYNGVGESGKSNEVSKVIVAALPKPSAPVLQLAARTATSLTFTYAPVPDGAGGIATVSIRLAPTPISWGATADAICPASPCTITGLTPDTSYDGQAVAFRGLPNVTAVFGPLSGVLTQKTATAPVTPGSPQGLTVK